MKKVLIITYYWPPAGGPGVQRWLKFVKYLQEFDVEPILYVPENPHYPIEDQSLVQEIPKDIKTYRHPIFEPYALARLFSAKKTKRISSGIIQEKNQSFLERFMLWIRGNLFIPDARKFWVRPSVRFLSEVIEREKINTIITTGPPHSVHLIGLALKKKHLKLQWLTDFRDPWTSIGYHKKLKLTTAAQKKHKKLEHEVLNNADAVITTSAATRREFKHLTKRPIKVITNGFDTHYDIAPTLDENFTISHIGSLLAGRNPKNLWKVFSELIAENAVFRTDLQLEFMGVVSQDVMESLYRYELGPYVKLRGYGSHPEAVRKQQQSQLLLLIEVNSDETRGIIPGKLFEYMAAKRPILAIGPKDWEAGEIIQETNSGKVFNYEADRDLKKTILEWYKAFKQGELISDSENIARYSRRALTEELVKLL